MTKFDKLIDLSSVQISSADFSRSEQSRQPLRVLVDSIDNQNQLDFANFLDKQSTGSSATVQKKIKKIKKRDSEAFREQRRKNQKENFIDFEIDNSLDIQEFKFEPFVFKMI